MNVDTAAAAPRRGSVFQRVAQAQARTLRILDSFSKQETRVSPESSPIARPTPIDVQEDGTIARRDAAFSESLSKKDQLAKKSYLNRHRAEPQRRAAALTNERRTSKKRSVFGSVGGRRASIFPSARKRSSMGTTDSKSSPGVKFSWLKRGSDGGAEKSGTENPRGSKAGRRGSTTNSYLAGTRCSAIFLSNHRLHLRAIECADRAMRARLAARVALLTLKTLVVQAAQLVVCAVQASAVEHRFSGRGRKPRAGLRVPAPDPSAGGLGRP